MGEKGSITGIFTVLVEADDMNDPIADSVRSILDGHIVLNRELATQNHFPAIDVLESISRLVRDLLTPEQINQAARARDAMALYRKNQDLINLGAYVSGSNNAIDNAIRLNEPLMQFLRQNIGQGFAAKDSWNSLMRILNETNQASPVKSQTNPAKK
jgi:flagellum-specific ATP synthase